MPNQRIRGNQITDPRTITQNEHEERADAKRVLIVDEDGNPINETNPLNTTAVLNGDVTIDGVYLKDKTSGVDAQVDAQKRLRTHDEESAATLTEISGKLDNLDLRDLLPTQDGVHLGDSETGVTAEVDAQRRLRTHDVDLKAAVDAVLSKIEDPGTLATEQTLQDVVAGLTDVLNAINGELQIRNLSATTDNVLMAGTENGQANGTVRYFVNNLRKQIMDSADRARAIVWGDFSNRKLRRVLQFNYTSGIFPGVTLRKEFTYTLVGNEYRLDGDAWSLII